MTNWQLKTTDANLELMTQVLKIKKPTAAVLANRGIRSKNAAVRYLRPMLSALGDLRAMKDVNKAIKRINEAIRLSQTIMVYGDYDADGVMSTVILYKMLKLQGADVSYYIPHREEEGYGLNAGAVKNIKGTDLLITCDNGIASLDEVALANSYGIDVIIIDHHESGFVETDGRRIDVVPEAAAVIDPKQLACPYPFKDMCAAGLCFRFAEAFYRYTNRNFSALHDELLVLAAMATVCDIVDLQGENRTLVKKGLEILQNERQINPGLGELLTLKGYADKPLDTFVFGFVVGPCINATGRLESAEMAVKLLISENVAERAKLAAALSALNEERKNITKICTCRLLQKASDSALSGEKVLVLEDTETHESIAGIVAGRIRESLHHPVFVLTRGAALPDHAGVAVRKGSGRSIPGYNLFEVLYANSDLLLKFGGHAMAAGLTLAEESVPLLRERLNAACKLQESDFRPILEIDMELAPGEITLELAQELAWLAPFGKGNHEPIFMTRNMELQQLRMIDEKNTMIFTFKNRLKGIAFGLNERFRELLHKNLPEEQYRRILSGQIAGFKLDIAYNVESNTYNGITSVQARLRDFKISTG